MLLRRDTCGKELEPRANSQVSELAADSPAKSRVTAALADNLTAASWETLDKNFKAKMLAVSQLSETVGSLMSIV